MTKFLIGGAVAAVFYSAFPGLVMALHVHSGFDRPAQSIFCANKKEEIPTTRIAITWPGAIGDE